MRCLRFGLILLVLGMIGQPAAGLEPEYSLIAPEVLAEIGIDNLPPVGELARLGLILPSERSVKSDVIDQAFITHWYSHYYMLTGGFDDDPIDEATIGQVCYGDDLTEAEDAPRMYRYTSWSPQFYNSYYNATPVDCSCDRIYTDQIRYFYAQVQSNQDREARILVGADEDIKVWLNGTLVMRHEAGEYMVDQYNETVQLLQGWNRLVIKVHYPTIGPPDDPGYEDRLFSVRFTDTAGRFVDDAGDTVIRVRRHRDV